MEGSGKRKSLDICCLLHGRSISLLMLSHSSQREIAAGVFP